MNVITRWLKMFFQDLDIQAKITRDVKNGDYTIVNLRMHFNNSYYKLAYKDYDTFLYWFKQYAPIKEIKEVGVFTNIFLTDSYIRKINSKKI